MPEAQQAAAPIQRVQVVETPKATPLDRMKSFLSPESPTPESKATSEVSDGAENTEAEGGESLSPDKPVPKVKAVAETEDREEAGVDEVSDDAQSEERQFSNLTELLEAGGFDLEKGLELELPVKVDGKEGTAKLRDLLKSYQLDSHHHNKLSELDTDRKAFIAERQTFQTERADKLLRLDAGLQTLERSLLGEFQQVDWNKLATDDPISYDAKFRQFHQHQAHLTDIAQQIAQERAVQQQAQQAQYAENLAEQRKLMRAKVPEWSNDVTREKDRAEIGQYLESLGISKAEFEAIDDHRYMLAARDAWKWNRLQKGKPATLKQVKAAPKLLKPGTQQSKDAGNRFIAQKERDRFRQSGKASDAVAPLKRILFQ